MSEFARVLGEIIEQGKKEKIFSIKELAQKARITPSYLSNLKQSNRKPPAQKTLLKLTDALRALNVSDGSVQRLLDAYNRQHLSQQDMSSLLETIIDEYKEEGSLFERLKQGVQTKGIVLKSQTGTRGQRVQGKLTSGCLEGDQHTFLVKAIQLLEKAQQMGNQGGKIYITWFHHDLADEEFTRDRATLRDTLRSFLWADSAFQVSHLWAGDIAREMTVIVDFLAQYIGTSQCFLFEIPYGQYLPEYLAVEDVGFIEAKPISENCYWMRIILLEDGNAQHVVELKGLIQYLEYLLGPVNVRKPLVKTNAPSDTFSITPVTRKMADVEQKNLKKELVLIKSSLSARYRPSEQVHALLKTSGLSPQHIETYLHHHQERRAVQEKRLEDGRERSIHEREFLKHEFRAILPKLSSSPSMQDDAQTLEAQLLQGQILGVLRAIKRNPSIHFALAEQEFLIRFSLNGDTAFLAFDPPGAQGKPPFERDDLLVRAWTEHPDVVYQLRHEFDAIWKSIAPQWRTDTESGRRHVVNFFITEPLKALLDANVEAQELWSFMAALVEQASSLDGESFIRELYTYEQAAQEIFLFSSNFPIITMPADVGPWEPRSPIRTRQIVFYALLQDIQRLHLVISQHHAEHYWKTGLYDAHTFTREEIEKHLRSLHALLLKFPKKITLELIPQENLFPVNVEVINGEWIFFQKTDATDAQQGIILQDRELADMLTRYIARNLSETRPQSPHDPQQVINWFRETFGIE